MPKKKLHYSQDGKEGTYPISIDYSHVGRRLKEERTRLHYTQEQVAEVVGISPAFVGHIERGERSMSLDTLIRFCNFYEVTIDYLMTDVLSLDRKGIAEQVESLLEGKTQAQQAAILDVMKAVVRHI